MSNTSFEVKSEIGISREEIVKKFDLPERKTKINTLLKLRQEQEQAVYCLCQSSDISKFMIGCEKCDEWYHGDCIGLEERDARLIKKWYCFDCIEKYGLKVVYFPHAAKKSSHKKKKEKKHKSQERYPYVRSSRYRCGRCSNCLQNEECGNKDYRDYFSDRHPRYPAYENEEENKTFIPANDETEEQERKFQRERKRREKEKRRLAQLEPMQCYGLNCSNLSRVNSKYCSEECGIALAKARLRSIIPSRLQQHNEFPSMVEHFDRVKLDDIRLRKKDAIEEIRRLDVKEQKLMELIDRAKKMPITEFEEEIEDESKSCCVTCGWEVPSRSIVRHMESCFRKFETQTAVEGLAKSNSDYCHIFCDHYNAAKKTFCMRLRYVCPVHFKPRKAGDDEVCGCPVVKPFSSSIFSEPEKYCQKPKKTCSQHCNWEILAMSDIDLERQREIWNGVGYVSRYNAPNCVIKCPSERHDAMWNKLSALVEQEARISEQIANRSGVLGFLLHSTKMNYSELQ